MNVPEILDLLRPANIAEEGSLTFKAAVIIFWGASNSWGIDQISDATGYTKVDVIAIINNLTEQKILVKDKLHMDIDEADPDNNFMELILVSMVASGELIRVQSGEPIEELTEIEETVKTFFDRSTHTD